MRRTYIRLTTLVAVAAVGVAASAPAQALTLGDIDVSSALNQRFTATIPLAEISAEDLETVTVSVAPNEAYERAGIERPEYLSSLSFDIADNKGRPKVIITSGQIAREPMLNLLIQARWKGGRIVRDYVVLLDPPATPQIKAATPKTAPAITAVAPPARTADSSVTAVPPSVAVAPPAAAPPKAVAETGEFFEPGSEKPASKAASNAAAPSEPAKPAPASLGTDDFFDSAAGRYGPVAPQQTLWNIATKVRPDPAVSMDQVMLALALANPDAIQRGTTVEKGAMLKVPSAAAMQAVGMAQASARLAALRAGRAAATTTAEKPVAAAVTPEKSADTAAAKSAPTAAVRPEPKPEPKFESKPASGSTDSTTKASAPTTVAAAMPPAATGSDTPAPSKPAVDTANPAAAPPPVAATAAPAPGATPAVASAAPGVLAQDQSQAQSCDDLWIWLAAAAVVLLAVIAGLLLLRRRRSPRRPASPEPRAPVAKPTAAAATSPSPDPMLTLAVEPGAAAKPQSVATAALPIATQTPAAAPAEDPIAEADFHLAYGLYDDAIQLLQQAQAHHPDRQDIAVKLAETFFAAGRAVDFEQTAQALQGHLPQAEWAKLALMGRQLCPQSALFQPVAGESLEADFDLGFGDDASTPASPASSASAVDDALLRMEIPSITPPPLDIPAPARFSESAHSPTAQFESLLDSLPSALPPPSMNGSPAPDLHIDDPHSIDFMLGQSLTPLGAATIAAQSPASGSGNGGAVDFKLDHVVDFSGTVPVSPRLTDEPLMAVSREPLIAAPAVDPLSISLQDLEVSLTPREQASDSEEIEVNTKLDLARAYVEMGDDEMAQGLLEEVRDVGSEQQKQEATVLLQRLGKA